MFSDCFDIHDARFKALIIPNVHLEDLWTGGRWLEGPVYVAAGKYLLFSDIPNDRVMRWDETDGSVSTFVQGAGYQNGHTIDREGRVLSCEHGSRSITRWEHDGSRTVLASHHSGKRINSPNDIVVKSDGTIWFTDPTYGIDSDYEGHKSPSELGVSNVFRLDPSTGETSIVSSDFVKPNGLAFNHDETKRYIVDSGATHGVGNPRHIRVLELDADGTVVTSDKVLSSCEQGIYDGLRLDELGNLWVGAADGVHCLSEEGDLLGKIRTPETAANIVFGGPKRNRLFICATRSLHGVYLAVSGATYPR